MYNLNLEDPLFLPHRGCAIQLEVAQGEAVVLIGENGLGKTTLFRRWQSLLPECSFLEQGPLDFFYDRKLSQVYHFFIGLNGINALRLERLWSEFQLKVKEDRTLGQLSGGEAQALKICLALAKDAQLYLLDEPSQFLDLPRKQVLKQHLTKLLNDGSSLIIVEHNVDWPPADWKKIFLEDRNGTLKVVH